VLEARFPVHVVGEVPVVTVPEEVDVINANGLRLALLHAATGGPAAIVVDMTLTSFCDSAGVRALMVAHKRAQAEGGELLLASPGDSVLRVLELTGIDQAITHFASLDKAVAAAAELTEDRSCRGDAEHD
jgi:anti-sigma B factor antagonist